MPYDFIMYIAKISATPQIKILQEKTGDILKVSPVRQIWWICETTLKKVAANQRISILYELAKNTKSVSLMVFGLRYCFGQHGMFDKNDQVKEELRWLDKKQVEEIKKLWIDAVTSIVNDNIFFKTSNPTNVLHMLRDLDPDKTKELLNSLINEDTDLDNFAEAIGKSGQDNIKGVFSHVTQKALDAFGSAEIIRARVKKRLESGIEDKSLNAIFNSILTGEGYYLVDNTRKGNFCYN
jgi:hypothetical protein